MPAHAHKQNYIPIQTLRHPTETLKTSCIITCQLNIFLKRYIVVALNPQVASSGTCLGVSKTVRSMANISPHTIYKSAI